MSNGKKKGNKAERIAANWFKQWTGLDFQRVPQSGGLRWQKADNISGDIICADYDHNREFPFSIEVKSYQNINFEHFILGMKSDKILPFWRQAESDGARAGKIPLLYMRYNGMEKDTFFVVCELKLFRKINRLCPKIERTFFKVYNSEYQLAIFHTDHLKQINYYDLKKSIDGKK